MMLTCQVKRGWEIADHYRSRGVRVICGGIGTMLHAEETRQHADAVFLGEAEGRMEEVFADWRRDCLKPVYDFFAAPPPPEIIGPARRDILKRDFYNYKGIQMVDLVHASRGCRFNCYPCCVSYLGGRRFRPRPVDRVIAEMAGIDNNRLFIVDNSLAQDRKSVDRVIAEMAAIDNNRLFIVDNSLAQDRRWEIDLFTEMIPLKKKWCCHPIEEDDEVLDLAARAGAWYVYQAVFDTSDHIRDRVKRYRDHGIAVEGTVLLGLDDQTEDDIRRLVDFLLEIGLDLAEFTVLTPFPHTRTYDDFEREKRILSYDWDAYTADRVVFRPRQMSPERLQEMLTYAWETFYREEPQNYKMFKLFKQVVEREKADGTYRPRRRDLVVRRFGREGGPGTAGETAKC
ncbi:MAG: radical SAM protein, partial [Deltaproteobacteria bacterium]|nr:radical SAM protein [Deltaproteobacteria bacterium]